MDCLITRLKKDDDLSARMEAADIIEKIWAEVRGFTPARGEPNQQHYLAVTRIHAALMPIVYPSGNRDNEQERTK